MPPRRGRAYVLVGPTASGKTSLAHRIARERQLPVLSADSMLVYRGMDIGTAKPSAREQREVRYFGIDLVEPACSFSAGDYLRYVREQVPECDLVVTGGTGLYVKGLLHGLQDAPPANPELRRQAEAVLAEQGLPGLQELAQNLAPGAFEQLNDQKNPRRIIRAIERGDVAPSGQEAGHWQGGASPVIAGLAWPRSALNARVDSRVREMLAAGWMEEAGRLWTGWGEQLSSTARQAIGYNELFSCLQGSMDRTALAGQISARTRQLAKRQMTWFRHQLQVRWLDRASYADDRAAAEALWACWQGLPPVSLVRP